jgi:hypothetical protein
MKMVTEPTIQALDWRKDQEYREAVDRLAALRNTGEMISVQITG